MIWKVILLVLVVLIVIGTYLAIKFAPIIDEDEMDDYLNNKKK